MVNYKKRKKRIKRQLLKRIKEDQRIKVHAINAVLPAEELQSPIISFTEKEIPSADLYLGKYDMENKEYQVLLDNRYKGTVKPIERFVNFNASILHYCSDCRKEWYSKPLWLLTSANQEHICGVDTSRVNPGNVRKKLTTNDKLQMYKMAEQGISKTKIANHFGISRPTVISHLRKAGLN